MDNHPIPQDITGFQFKLIGDMTIKQFAYLALGTIIGWAIFSLPIISFIKIPFSAFFIVLGVAFAFFSVSGRPMDTMIVNFLKATLSPTQFVYQKIGAAVRYIPQQKVSIPTPSLPVDNKESNFLTSIYHLFSPSQIAKPQEEVQKPKIITATYEPMKPQEPEIAKLSEPREEKEIEELKQEEEKLKLELQKAKEEELKVAQSKTLDESAHQKVLEIEKLLNDTIREKQALENELINLKRQLEEQKKQVFSPGNFPQPLEVSQNVRSVPSSQGIAVGMPITSEYPNLISGIIKDPRGNPLQNILVEVKDKEGNPVRAFKTNPLGQFSASTPLSNGIYRIEFEDPQGKNKFEIIEFEAKGDVILPIEVLSIDTREELRKELFKT